MNTTPSSYSFQLSNLTETELEYAHESLKLDFLPAEEVSCTTVVENGLTTLTLVYVDGDLGRDAEREANSDLGRIPAVAVVKNLTETEAATVLAFLSKEFPGDGTVKRVQTTKAFEVEISHESPDMMEAMFDDANEAIGRDNTLVGLSLEGF